MTSGPGGGTNLSPSLQSFTGPPNRIIFTGDNGQVQTLPEFEIFPSTKIASFHKLSVQANPPQVLAAGFTIDTDSGYARLDSVAGTISSDVAIILTSGDAIGQFTFISNITAPGSGNIFTLKSGGNVQLPGGVDYDLYPQSSMLFIWDGTTWITVSASKNS